MQLFNSMTRKKEEFVPLKEGHVGIYVCGPTVYNLIHIGNARPLVVYDTLRRYLEYRGYSVTFVQNFTDVDDKMIKRANEEGCTVADIADKYIPEYYNDSHAMHVRDATICPRATKHIKEIIKLVSQLIEAGHAYVSDNGDVYFSVRSYPAYGKLSGQSIESLESGARVDPTEHKHDPLDFALWKAEKPNEPSWDSPWGKGRPGWHIECSAMSMKVLGETFDIHAGGVDLLFPHHENEIAQSEAATGKPFARYWMHNGHINVNNQKMSKSLGNFFWVRDILKDYDADVLRLFFLFAHYRSPLNFSRELMDQAQSALERIRTTKLRISGAIVSSTPNEKEEKEFLGAIDEYRQRFIRAMDDDLNTADALGILFEYIRAANTFVTAQRSKAAIEAADQFLEELIGILGISTAEKAVDFPDEAIALLEQRTAARKVKDWARADAIREELKNMGFAIEDSPKGPILKKI
ncbi:MAG: cysteine--tRNA ligase [Clostridia bacterium]|nr:cysteine--tRNA ligase [Clostridia bacterium]